MILIKARVWDFKRKFVEAASKYYELSLNTLISEHEKMHALNNALNCTILAPAGVYEICNLFSFDKKFNKTKLNRLGKQRSRLLATLFKDERCQKLTAYNILEKCIWTE